MSGFVANNRRLSGFVVAAIFAATACAEDLPQDPPPDTRVRPIFDSETGVIPLPNGAALDDDGTLPRRDGAGRDSAQGEFFRWFSELPGWPRTTPIQVPFDGLLDPSTVTSESVRLGKVADSEWTEIPAAVSYDEVACGPGCESVVTITPQPTLRELAGLGTGALEFATDYAVAISRDVTDVAGREIGEPTAFFYAMSPEPLVDSDGDPNLALFEDQPERALALEGLRLHTARYLEAAQTVVDRERLALVYGWTTRLSPGVEFDTTAGRLPLPNDLALDADGTFPRSALDFCGDDAPNSCAQGDFDAYLDRLHAWPISTPINVPWQAIEGAAIDPESIDEESVQLWRLDDEEPGPVGRTVSVGDASLDLSPTEEIEPGGRYAVVVTRDVVFRRGEASYPLLPDATTALAVQENPVADFSTHVPECGAECEGGQVCAGGACVLPSNDCRGACGAGEACVAGTCEDRVCATSLVAEIPDCDAESIELARRSLSPVVELIDEVGDLEYDDLAALSVWTAQTDTFIEFDLENARIPFPSSFLTAGCPPERPICGIYNPDDSSATGELLDLLSQRVGFSTFATNFVPTSGLPIDQSSLEATTSVRFAQVPGLLPELLEASQFGVEYESGHILVSFNEPLAPETFSIGVITTEALGSNGFPVQPAPTFALIRNPHPLIDEAGASQVEQLDDTTAARLEVARLELEELFDNAGVLGLSRETIASAWPFTTGRTTTSTQRLRARTHAQIGSSVAPATAPSPDVVVEPTSLEDPDFPGVQVPMDSVAEIHRSVQFETVNWVGETGIVPDDETVSETVGVTLYIPEDPDPAAGQGCEAPYDVAIVQHGLGSWRNQPALAMANDFAQECVAVVAIDLPVHGGRTPGASSLHPTTRPNDSGDTFLTADLVRSVAHYQQAVVDLSVVTRLVREGGFDGVTGTTFSDGQSQVGYLGVSLGGQIGTAFLAVEPDPVAGVINVAGANLSLYLTESDAFSGLLDQLGVTPGTVEFIQTIHFLQWATDPVDPFTFAAAVTQDPVDVLTYDPQDSSYDSSPGSTKEVLVQMVEGDAVAPNVSTNLLAATFGVDLVGSTYIGTVHGFLSNSDSATPDFAQAECGRRQGVAYLANAFAGDASVPPALQAQICVDNF